MMDEWHVNDILQKKNYSHSKPAELGAPSLEIATPVDPDPQTVIAPKTSSHPPDDSAKLETTPAS